MALLINLKWSIYHEYSLLLIDYSEFQVIFLRIRISDHN